MFRHFLATNVVERERAAPRTPRADQPFKVRARSGRRSRRGHEQGPVETYFPLCLNDIQ